MRGKHHSWQNNRIPVMCQLNMPNVRIHARVVCRRALSRRLDDRTFQCEEREGNGTKPMTDDARIDETADLAEVDAVDVETPPPPKVLTPAAQRALAEAAERRLLRAAQAQGMPKEIQGPKGPEPTRYGDWETKGIISDF
jgi:hypothetical protein